MIEELNELLLVGRRVKLGIYSAARQPKMVMRLHKCARS